jgi:release factor glutamine methyltransferase
MRIPSNKISEIARFIKVELKDFYDLKEINSFIYILFEKYCGINKMKFLSEPNQTVSESELLKINFAVKDLKSYKPIQYIIGNTEFFGLNFLVNSSVLIPRQETEELVNWIISDNKNTKAKLNVLDIGTGSGCIAIALSKSIPDSTVTAIDISEKAIQTAKRNAELNTVEISFVEADILNFSDYFSLKEISEKFDIIVSNPPYVTLSDKKQMKANVIEYEPNIALFVEDEDPLIFYSAILDFASGNLTDKGKLFFEINESLGKETLRLIEEKGFSKYILKKDINNKDRMICCSK